MKTYRLMAATLAAVSLIASTADAASNSGRMPPMSERMKGKTAAEKTHMTLVGAERYGRKPVTASVDAGKHNRDNIKVTYNPQ